MNIFPFDVPLNFLCEIGLPNTNRYVGLYWSSEKDFLAYNDGTEVVGKCEEHVWIDFIEQLGIATWMLDNNVNFGDCSDESNHWLVFDTLEEEVYYLPCEEAELFVSKQG